MSKSYERELGHVDGQVRGFSGAPEPDPPEKFFWLSVCESDMAMIRLGLKRLRDTTDSEIREGRETIALVKRVLQRLHDQT